MHFETSMSTIHGKNKKSYENNKSNTSAPKWKEKCDPSGKSYSVSDIQHFEYFIKLHEKYTNEIQIYI